VRHRVIRVNIHHAVVTMRHLTLAGTAALMAGALAGAAPAHGERPPVFAHGATGPGDEPVLRASFGRVPAQRERTTVSQARASDRVRRAVERAHLAGQINSDQRAGYLKTYRGALRLVKNLFGQRRTELSYVIDTLNRIARAGRLSAGRMPALFLILERNREWWAGKGAPPSGTRVRFPGSELLFQYYPRRGLQLQPLANFGLANGYWQGHRDGALRRLIDELVAVKASRGGFTTWEYYFHFGEGSPPWISGMAQATAMQALSRAATRLEDPELLEIARRGVRAFERATPVGVRVVAGQGAWYALYSFAPRLYVLNGMLQSLIGLNSYVSYSGDQRARGLFDQGDATARALITSYDTGAWSLYSRYPGRPGPEADLNYHTLNRDFSRRLCRATSVQQYCDAADKFSRYLREPPELDPHRAVPSPAVAGRGVKFRFTLSKVGRVGITVTDASLSARVSPRARSARTYLSTSAPFSRGKRFFRWVPPRSSRERTYAYKLSARDLAGNSGSVSGTIRVKPGRRD